MILQALYRLAADDRLIDDPDFEMKPVRWLITVGPGGDFRGFSDTNSTPPEDADAEVGKKKPKKKVKPVATAFVLPRDPSFNMRAGTNNYTGPLFDKREFVFGVPEENYKGEVKLDRAAIRMQLFREKAASILASTSDEGVAAVVGFLQRIAAGDGPAPPADCAPGDLFAFVYAPDVDRLVTSRPAFQAWWKRERAAAAESGTGPEFQCLVTGESFRGAGLFPKVKRVPGVQGDISLVSFNSSAFLSYGLESNENAPISREASEAIATALNRLLHPAYPNPSKPGEVLPRRSFRLSGDTGLCYWAASRGGSGDAFTDFLEDLFEANVEQVPQLYRSIWRGEPPREDLDMSPFYGLVITGTQGRAILRDWFETTLGDAKEAIGHYFEDIRIVRNAPWKKDETPPPAIALRTLLASIAEQGKQDNIPGAMAGQVARAALTGEAFPFALLTRAVERARAEIGHDDWLDLQRRDARAALIKAVLNRRRRLAADDETSTTRPITREVTESMDPHNTHEGYVLGCLMAVLERLQQEALGDVNASVVDKYFSGASAAPRATFDRLVRNARHHARKAADSERAGMVRSLERLIDELMIRINVNDRDDRKAGRPIGFPLTLSIEEQGLFVIGYHHMRHWLWMNKEERDAWEAAHPDAPSRLLWNTRKAAVAAAAAVPEQ